RDLEAAARDGGGEAQLAIDVFCHRVAGAVGAMAVAAGGMDAVVFTGGIGERSPGTRAAISSRLGVLGAELDPAANEAVDGDGDIAPQGSAARVLVVSSREEVIAARAAREVVGT
ncbi:MAG: hypothetical protein ACRDQC_00925, partial [Gaiellales bacterium]